MPTGFLEQMRLFQANVSITAGTTRGQVKPGKLAAIRASLADLDLQSFSVLAEDCFQEALDQSTKDLVSKEVPWGTARKTLNIFLRDAYYNFYLRPLFSPNLPNESWFEVPLDSRVGLKLSSYDRTLKKWETIKDLASNDHHQYQQTARCYAQKIHKVARVHLDIYLWPGYHPNAILSAPPAIDTE